MKLPTAQEARAWSNYKYDDPFMYILTQIYDAISKHQTSTLIILSNKYANDELMTLYVANLEHNGYSASYSKWEGLYHLYINWYGEENDTI